MCPHRCLLTAAGWSMGGVAQVMSLLDQQLGDVRDGERWIREELSDLKGSGASAGRVDALAPRTAWQRNVGESGEQKSCSGESR